MKELLGTEKFDGIPIDGYEGRFSGAFDIEDKDGRRLSWGDDVLVVVKARVKSATVRETASGDVKRVNILRADEVRFVMDSGLRRQITETLQLEGHFSPTLFDNATAVDAESIHGARAALGDDITQSALEDNARDMFSKTVDDDIDESVLDVTARNDIPVIETPVDSNGDSAEHWDSVWKKDDQVLARFLETGE